MYPSLKVLNQSKNGILTFCNQSKLFQLVYNNLCFEFYEWELEAFDKHLTSLDMEYWNRAMPYAPTSRKTPISVGNKCFVILVNKAEVKEIKSLLQTQSPTVELISTKDIDYSFIEN
nr:DUF6686 family protein [Allomuricauda sp.]